jgi:hypothetical protein
VDQVHAAGSRVHDTDSTLALEIKMNDLDLMKTKGTRDLILALEIKMDY